MNCTGKPLKAIRYSFTGTEGIIACTLVVFYHINGALETALCMPSHFKVVFFSLDHISFGNYQEFVFVTALWSLFSTNLLLVPIRGLIYIGGGCTHIYKKRRHIYD